MPAPLARPVVSSAEPQITNADTAKQQNLPLTNYVKVSDK
jgi:hypothetical protein